MSDPAIDHDGTLHRARSTVVEPWLHTRQSGKAQREVLVADTGVSRWTSTLDPIRFVGMEAGEDRLVAEARERFPAGRFEALDLSEPTLPVAAASLDVALCIGVVQSLSETSRSSLIHEMWLATRPGGRLLFLEEFVFWGKESPVVAPLPVSEFVDLLLEATTGRVVLEHMEALRYPGEDGYRAGLLSLTRLGP